MRIFSLLVMVVGLFAAVGVGEAEPLMSRAEQLDHLRLTAPDSPLLGQPFPEFEAKNLRRKRRTIDDYLDTPHIVVLLKTEHYESLRAMREINKLTVTARRSDMDVLLVFEDSSRVEISRFVSDKGAVATGLKDKRATVRANFEEMLGAAIELPYYVGFNPDGEIIYASAAMPELLQSGKEE